jgi:hypothetical protein
MAKQQLWNRALVHFLVGLLSLITAYAAVVPVNNGTDFVAGVAQFCKTGGDLVLTLSTNISIDQSIPFPSGGALSCVQPGRLVLDGASSSGQTAVLDAAMRSDLTLPWNSQTPTLVWQVKLSGLTEKGFMQTAISLICRRPPGLVMPPERAAGCLAAFAAIAWVQNYCWCPPHAEPYPDQPLYRVLGLESAAEHLCEQCFKHMATASLKVGVRIAPMGES